MRRRAILRAVRPFDEHTMSRMKARGLVTALGAGMAMAASAARALANVAVGEPNDPAALPPRRPARRKAPKTRYRPRWVRQSKYMPHQGPQECARRLGMSLGDWMAAFRPAAKPKAKRARKPKAEVARG